MAEGTLGAWLCMVMIDSGSISEHEDEIQRDGSRSIVTENKSIVFKFADVEVREREFCLVKAGEVLPVEPKTFRVLLYLLRNPQKLISKEELLNAVWGDAAVTDSSLTRTVAQLRRLLGDEIRNPRYIETVATVGYRLICPVEVIADSTGKSEAENQTVARNGPGALPTPLDPMIPTAVPEKTKVDGSRRLWLTLGAPSVAAALAVGYWYLLSTPPPPRITAYSQITFDGARKTLIGTDGNRLYFASALTGPIAQVAISGGAISTIPVSVPNFAFPEDVSPDGANFLIATNEKGYVLDRPQWNIRLPGGSLRRLPDAGNAAFSPDGNSVAYQTGAGELWVARSDGSGAQKLSSGQPLAPNDPAQFERSDRLAFGRVAWSPNGSVLRFENRSRLWEISASGSQLHEVVPGWHLSSRQCCGSWTPDGKLFVFLDAPIGPISQPEIWALSEGGGLLPRPPTHPVRLMSGPIAWDQPIPGKDGKKIFATGKTRRGELVRFDLKTGQFQPLLGGISAHFVSFSNDGQFVAYVSYPEGILWSANRDGSNRVQLTETPINALMPRWSPDGTHILFADTSSAFAAYIVAARGGNPQKLPGNPEPQGDANWSADGKKVVFSTAGPFTPNGNLRILDLATHQVTTVAGSEGLYSPRWSPDGRFIAALPVDASALKIFDLKTQQWSELIQESKVAFPSWSRDSQSIYFNLSNSNGNGGIFRIRVAGGTPERVADLKSIRLGGWWSWVGLDSTDAPMVMRDVGGDDIYTLTLEQK